MTKNSNDQLQREIQTIRRINKVRKKISYRKNHSRLNKYKGEIMKLRQIEEASYQEIQIWLRQHKRIKVWPSTIQRRFELWINGER